MKIPNAKQQVSYGVCNHASFWMMREGGELVKAKTFWPFVNCAQATKCARKVPCGKAIRRIVETRYAVDE